MDTEGSRKARLSDFCWWLNRRRCLPTWNGETRQILVPVIHVCKARGHPRMYLDILRAAAHVQTYIHTTLTHLHAYITRVYIHIYIYIRLDTHAMKRFIQRKIRRETDIRH